MRAVHVERVAWRRVNVPHHYLGDLSVADGRIRLLGRDPGTRIDVLLSIPFEEIQQVRTSRSAREQINGDPSVVIELADSQAICLQEVGQTAAPAFQLARRLEAGLENASRRQATAALGGGGLLR